MKITLYLITIFYITYFLFLMFVNKVSLIIKIEYSYLGLIFIIIM